VKGAVVDHYDNLHDQLRALVEERQSLTQEGDEILAAVATEKRNDLTAEEDARWAAIQARCAEIDTSVETKKTRIAEIEAVRRSTDSAAEIVRRYQPSGRPGRETATSTDDPLARGREFGAPHEVRDAAFRAIERVTGLTDEHRAAAERLVRSVDHPDGRLARHILITGRDAYRSAFQKGCAGHPELWTDDERRAIAEVRSSSLTDSQGGYAVPFTLDPTIIHTATYTGSNHPWRQLATVSSIVTDTWNGVSSAGVTARMAGEFEEVVDGAPTLSNPSITIKKADAFVRYSEEIYMDWSGYESEIRDMFMWAKDVLEGSQFTLGSGSGNNVNGIVTDLVAASTPIVASAGSNTFTAPDPYALENALADRFLPNASFVSSTTIYNLIRQFDTGGGSQMWERIGAGMPSELIGYPAYKANNMDSTYGSGENYVMILGDIRQCYRIVDRVGMTIQGFPALFGTTNNLPDGSGGVRMVWRFGAKVLNSTAAKILNVT